MALAKLNLLHLLGELYGRVHFALAVHEETVVEGVRQGYEDAGTLRSFLDQMGWRPQQVEPVNMPAGLREAHLDRGERDTLALAISLNSRLVLMDEIAGRQSARERGLAVRGTLGVLIEAYRRELISADQLRLYLGEAARRQDIWVNRVLVERLLQEVFGD
jgi:predicted nucleic acid-binding protein